MKMRLLLPVLRACGIKPPVFHWKLHTNKALWLATLDWKSSLVQLFLLPVFLLCRQILMQASNPRFPKPGPFIFDLQPTNTYRKHSQFYPIQLHPSTKQGCKSAFTQVPLLQNLHRTIRSQKWTSLASLCGMLQWAHSLLAGSASLPHGA